MQTISDRRSLHRRALEAATEVVGRVRPADLARPTPCAEWDLRALLAHAIGQNHGFAEAVAAPDAPASAVTPREFDDLMAGWNASVAAVTTAFATAAPDREVLLVELHPQLRFPVAAVVGFHLLDTVVHTWDVATAFGQPFRPDAELLAATAELAEQVPTGPVREQPGGAFGPMLNTDDDDLWTATLGRLGRSSV